MLFLFVFDQSTIPLWLLISYKICVITCIDVTKILKLLIDTKNRIPMCKKCLSISLKIRIFTAQYLVTFDMKKTYCSP